jgi:serine phosphatase RsbU (regulator of sigma subunit)
MRSDPAVQNLLFIITGAVIINAFFAAALWRSTRDQLFRSLFVAWAITIAAVVPQSVLVEGDLAVTLGFAFTFFSNLGFAHVLATVTGVATPWRPLVGTFAGGVSLSVAARSLGAPFELVALPTAAAVAAPALAVSFEVFRKRWSTLHVQGRALVASCLLYSLHNLDFAFLRHRPSLETLGFSLAMLVTFAISISAPAAVLELVTQRQARLAAQLDIARTLQTRLVPPDARLDGLEFAAYMRAADSVGGDYLQCFHAGDVDWFFVGDVTGHGFGAGLFTLMAHSAFASIIETRPEISPRELNHLANRVLSASLARLQERRSMTIVSVRRDGATGRFLVSGSHEDLLVYRAASGTVESIPMSHFPFGLGFVPDLKRESIGDSTVELAPGDLLFAGTDGVFEAPRDGDHRSGHFGMEPVQEALVTSDGLPLSEVRRRIVERLESFTHGQYDDDVAFLMLRAGSPGEPA